MAWEDEKKKEPVRSHAESLTRADAGKQEQLERKAKERGQLSKLKRDVLRGSVEETEEGKTEEEGEASTKQEQQDQTQPEQTQQEPETFTTKTIEQKLKEEVKAADTKPTPDKLVQEGKRHDALLDQIPYEKPQEPG
jgi:formylmethanofuran dehydrogenase subunit E